MDSSRRGGKNGYVPKKSSARVKELVNYDEKQHMSDLTEDIQHGVAHRALNELEEHVNDLGESWETNSLFEDALEDLAEDKFFDVSRGRVVGVLCHRDSPERKYLLVTCSFSQRTAADLTISDPEACTPEEAVRYRQLLRAVGPEEFCKRTVDAGVISARKLLTAFGIRPPSFLEDAEDDAYFGLLSLALSRELSKRAKIQKYNTVDDAVDLLKSAKNIIVLTGAGISTSLGIPDFRSKGTGLYSKLEHLGLSDPQEVFDISFFKHDPTIFYSVARDILPNTERFSPTHAFIALLQEKGKLLTNYSQNIDNLEAKAGISPDKLVQCHGSFATASCVKCGYKVVGDSLFPEIKAGKIPRCRKCAQGSRTTNNSRKRKVNRDGTEKKVRRRPGEYDSNSDSEFDLPTTSCGIMKPDITFFGEPLPDEFSKRLTEHDRDLVDLVIVIGTSLKVAPVSEVVPFLPPHIPQIYISRTPVSHVNFDVDLLGDCDIVVSELCRKAGWDLKHEMIPEGQVIETKLVDGYPSRHIFTQVKPEPESEPKSKPELAAKEEDKTNTDKAKAA
ncbi:DHS-like NAD/FAD-binding domain-containing protein [Cercophora scortea]|uniref:DHS-like NAD/FAD-binding domain-containing protein n=1 Tax=Cercophora scortea TaxID=314031 RepID=A0AAE0IVK9_9PEZI|nr:DHS-like NAD/FAD-binding domain-containing protein [Cercophora scortea]